MTGPERMGEGGCQCGAVRYRLRGEPLTSYACHCTRCQAATGAAFSLSLIVPRKALETIGGEAVATTYSMGGGDRQRAGCADCGGVLWFASAEMPEIVALKTGTLDDPGAFPPVAHVWTRSAQPWFRLPADAPAWAEQPEMETLIALWRDRVGEPAHDAVPAGPRQVVAAWVEAFNRGDADEVAAFYAADAVNHQVTQAPVEGCDAIRAMFAREFADVEMTCLVENLFEDGEWAMLEWRDPLGLRGCGFFHVVDGLIRFQRGYWDRLSFLRQHGLALPRE